MDFQSDLFTGPCDENIVFPCGPYMCLNKSLVCNGRENCWSYGFDEEASMCGKC